MKLSCMPCHQCNYIIITNEWQGIFSTIKPYEPSYGLKVFQFNGFGFGKSTVLSLELPELHTQQQWKALHSEISLKA